MNESTAKKYEMIFNLLNTEALRAAEIVKQYNRVECLTDGTQKEIEKCRLKLLCLTFISERRIIERILTDECLLLPQDFLQRILKSVV